VCEKLARDQPPVKRKKYIKCIMLMKKIAQSYANKIAIEYLRGLRATMILYYNWLIELVMRMNKIFQLHQMSDIFKMT